MSSNTSIGVASKGSKFQMQRITLPENRQKFLDFINEDLIWLSPRIEDQFREYRMNNAKLLNELGISQQTKNKYINSFWPNPQPQWDGIGIGKDNTLFLFEAKSHISEIVPGKDGNPQNDKQKYDSIMKVAKTTFGIEDTLQNRNIWCRTYYQISNRIAFADKLKEIISKKPVLYKDVKLFFLNFVNDKTWEDNRLMVRTTEEWDSHYDRVILPRLGISREQLAKENIYIVNFDLKMLEK